MEYIPQAFPDDETPGMSLVDYFAAHLAAAMVKDKSDYMKNEAFARKVYEIADALVKEASQKRDSHYLTRS